MAGPFVMESEEKMEQKKRRNFTFDESTIERLQQLAYERHTSMSQVLTDLIWAAPVKNSQLRGQMSLDLGGKPKKEKKGHDN